MSAVMLSVGLQEGHPAFIKPVSAVPKGSSLGPGLTWNKLGNIGWLNNKYERYCGPGRHPLAYLLYYMPVVSPACA